MKFTEYLNEVMLTFGKKTHPKFGQVIILAGGAGSGKGFIKSNLLGVDGITLDVDKIKELAIHSKIISDNVKKKFGKGIENLDLKDSKNVQFLHGIFKTMKFMDRKIEAVLKSVLIADPKRKPNIIFDVTLSDMNKLVNISNDVQEMGYWKKNISLVWVLNTIDVALYQNSIRDRKVPEDILINTHDGVSYTMSKIVKMGKDIKKYLDGEIYLIFNQAKIDNKIKKSDKGGMFVDFQDYLLLKPREKDIEKDIENKVIAKIKRYVPNPDVWSI